MDHGFSGTLEAQKSNIRDTESNVIKTTLSMQLELKFLEWEYNNRSKK